MQAGVWSYAEDLDVLQRNILAAVEGRRRLSGLDDLMSYLKDEVRATAGPPAPAGLVNRQQGVLVERGGHLLRKESERV